MKKGNLLKRGKLIATVGTITDFKAVGAKKFRADFDAAVPDIATIEVTRAGAVVSLTPNWNTEKTSVELESATDLKTGEYTISVKIGEETYTKTTVVDAEKLEIKLINTDKGILTSSTKTVSGSAVQDTAYIYYDVTNQYDESKRTSANIRWTITGTQGDPKVDTSTGKITVKSPGVNGFTYNTELYVVGVDNKTGATISQSVKIGMPQAVDSVKFTGKVVNKNDKTKALDALPSNFAKDTYYLLFNAYDQNGNVIPAADIKEDSLSFIGTAANPLAIDSQLKLEDAGTSTFTVGGESYRGILINPGQQVDKGGEVTILVMSNGTGNKSEYTFTIGDIAILSSLELSAPSGIVKDGGSAELNYTAKDTNGNNVTSYETIARSSNSVNLTASIGDVRIEEKDDGTAGIYWIDDSSEYGGNKRFEKYDGRDRNVLITTIVIGGEGSSSLQLSVSDASYPAAIKSVILNADNNDTLVMGNTATVSLGTGAGRIEYLDQYNQTMTDVDANAFFTYGYLGSDKDTRYGVRVKSTAEENAVDAIGLDKKVRGDDGLFVKGTDGISFNAKKAATCAVEYAIATQKGDNVTDVSSVKRVNYTTVDLKDVVNDLEVITNAPLYQLKTSNSNNPNGMTIASTVTGGTLELNAEGNLTLSSSNNDIILKGKTRDGLSLTIPNDAYSCAENSEVKVNSGKIESVSYGAIKWSDLYDVNSSRLTRINTNKAIRLTVNDGSSKGVNVSKNITLSDAASVPTVLEWWFNNEWWNIVGADRTLKPDSTKINAMNSEHWKVKDQYGQIIPFGEGGINPDKYQITFKVSNLVESNDEKLTHLAKSFTIKNNGSKDMNIMGAEIGDKYKLTATLEGYGLTKDVNITVGSDTKAWFSYKEPNNDKDFRMAPFPEESNKIGLAMNR